MEATLNRGKLDDLAQTGGLPVLGYTLSWRLNDIEVAQPDLKAMMTAHGFADFAPALPTPRAALKRALIEWIRRNARSGAGPALASGGAVRDDGTGHAQRVNVSVVNSAESKWLAFVVVLEDVDLAKLGLKHGTRLRVILAKDGSKFIATSDAAGSVEDNITQSQQAQSELAPIWDRYRNLITSYEVAVAVRRIVETMQPVTLRAEGGYYFIPASQADTVERLTATMADLDRVPSGRGGGTAFLLALPQLDLGRAKGMLAQAAHASLLQEVHNMDTYLGDFLAAEPGTVRPATLAAQLTKFKAVREKAEAYSDLLGMRREAIAQGIDALVAKAKTVVLKGAEAAGAEEPAAAPAAPATAAELDDVPF